MNEIELSPAAREAALRKIADVSPSLAREVQDDGLHGRAGDADLELAAARCAALARRMKGR